MKKAVKSRVGSLASWMFPSVSKRLANGAPAGDSVLHRLVRSTLTEQAAKRGDWNELRIQLAGYWRGGEGDAFYHAYPERFETWFLGPHYGVIDALRRLCDDQPGQFRELYEIGCGDGRVLRHIAEKFPEMERLIGIDINAGVIHRNLEVYRDCSRMKFTTADALPWLQDEAQPGCVLLAYGGVLEYFTEEEVRAIFARMLVLSPAVVVLAEPLADDYNLETESASRSYGEERSFSHNHRAILVEQGFAIAHFSECYLDHRWQMLVATGA